MKTLSLLLAAAVIALSFPACATAPKKKDACCSDGSCAAPASGHSHHGKKKES
jgi:hypothetical protein